MLADHVEAHFVSPGLHDAPDLRVHDVWGGHGGPQLVVAFGRFPLESRQEGPDRTWRPPTFARHLELAQIRHVVSIVTRTVNRVDKSPPVWLTRPSMDIATLTGSCPACSMSLEIENQRRVSSFELVALMACTGKVRHRWIFRAWIRPVRDVD